MPPLLALAQAKYDDYQQFSPGLRFIESLAIWLNQFDEGVERRTAYQLIKDRLVYFSAGEVLHLIQIAFPDHLRPILMKTAAAKAGLPFFRVGPISNSPEYQRLLVQSLYVGLSDGSQVGLLRRVNPGIIRHEHTLITYDPPEQKKVDEMLGEHLPEALRELAGEEVRGDEKFKVLVLVDDFTASGISFFRHEEKDGGEPELKGKLAKIFRKVQENRFHGLLEDGPIDVCILFYIATPSAIERIRRDAQAFLDEHLPDVTLHVTAVQMLGDLAEISVEDGDDLKGLLKKYVDPEKLLDKHWKKGLHEEPYLGYNQCALPVCLYHNTPNNSLPILWFYTGPLEQRTPKLKALFPRTMRHGKQ